MDEFEKNLFELQYRDQFKNYPIYKRVSNDEVDELLSKQLEENGIVTDFEFAIFDEDFAFFMEEPPILSKTTSTFPERWSRT